MTEAAAAEAQGILPEEWADWDASSRARPRTSAPVLAIDGFEGRLDWLLEMARARKLDLARLSIVALVDAFARAMETALERRDVSDIADLSRWADWLVMAAALALLRSQLLLPRNAPEVMAAQLEAEALRQRLVDRAAIRNAADWLEARPQLGRELFHRGQARIVGEPASTGPARTSAGDNDRAVDIVALFRACLVALRVPGNVTAYLPKTPPVWTVGDALARIRRLLPEVADGSALGVFLPKVEGSDAARDLACRAALACTVVAGLELARGGEIELDQDGAFAPIFISRRAEAMSPGTKAATAEGHA